MGGRESPYLAMNRNSDDIEAIEHELEIMTTPAQVFRVLTSQTELRKWWASKRLGPAIDNDRAWLVGHYFGAHMVDACLDFVQNEFDDFGYM